MRRFQTGDPQAFEHLVVRYKDRVVNILHQMLHDYDRSLDLAQETFVRFYCHGGRIRGEGRVSAYLFRIATNLAIDECRRRKRRGRVLVEDGRKPDPQVVDGVPSPAAGPDELWEAEERRRLIWQALEELPEKYRVLLVLRELEGLSYEELCQVTGLRAGTLKSRLNRARSRLKRKLRPLLETGDSTANREKTYEVP